MHEPQVTRTPEPANRDPEVAPQPTPERDVASSLAGQGGPVIDDETIVGRAGTYPVSVPADGDPAKVFRNLLREQFGFTDEDLAASASLNMYVTQGDSKTAKTAAQVLDEARKNAGKIRITVTAAQDAAIRTFKRDRSRTAKQAVETVIAASIPVELRPTIAPLLTALVGGDRAARFAAASQLQALISDEKRLPPSAAKALREAIAGLQAAFGMQGDAMLSMLHVQLVMAQDPPGTDIADLAGKRRDPFHPTADNRTPNEKQAAEQIATAHRQIERIRDQLRARQDAGTLDREEAARLYEMMAFLHETYMGERNAAESDRHMARLYRSDQVERDAAQQLSQAPGERLRSQAVLSMIPRDATRSMRASTPDERELRELQGQRAEAIEVWTGLTETGEVPEFPKTKTFETQTSGRLGNERAEQVEALNGGMSLARTFADWYETNERMNQLAEWSRREKQLKHNIFRANTVPIPPKPEQLRAAIAYLEARAAELAARGDARAATARRYAAAMRSSLDACRAFWDAR